MNTDTETERRTAYEADNQRRADEAEARWQADPVSQIHPHRRTVRELIHAHSVFHPAWAGYIRIAESDESFTNRLLMLARLRGWKPDDVPDARFRRFLIEYIEWSAATDYLAEPEELQRLRTREERDAWFADRSRS